MSLKLANEPGKPMSLFLTAHSAKAVVSVERDGKKYEPTIWTSMARLYLNPKNCKLPESEWQIKNETHFGEHYEMTVTEENGHSTSDGIGLGCDGGTLQAKANASNATNQNRKVTRPQRGQWQPMQSLGNETQPVWEFEAPKDGTTSPVLKLELSDRLWARVHEMGPNPALYADLRTTRKSLHSEWTESPASWNPLRKNHQQKAHLEILWQHLKSKAVIASDDHGVEQFVLCTAEADFDPSAAITSGEAV